LSNYQSFDTSGSQVASQNLARYLDNLRPATKVIALTADDAYANLQPAFASLRKLGLNIDQLNIRGKFAFITKGGTSSANTVRPAGGNNAQLAVFINPTGAVVRQARELDEQIAELEDKFDDLEEAFEQPIY